jgi:exosome complex component RRP41
MYGLFLWLRKCCQRLLQQQVPSRHPGPRKRKPTSSGWRGQANVLLHTRALCEREHVGYRRVSLVASRTVGGGEARNSRWWWPRAVFARFAFRRMAPVDYLSPEGLRVDGRRAAETRLLRCRMGAQAGSVDGSCYFEQGNTKVLVSVCGPKEAKRKADGVRGVLHCDVTTVPFATGEHRPQSHGDRSASEMAAQLRKIFEPVVQLHLYPRSQIEVSVVLLESDGGVRSAIVNATTLALLDAGIALEDLVCACSAGSVQGALLLDLSAQEDNVGSELSVGLLPRTERISFVQLESKVPLSAMQETLNFALEGCRHVFAFMSRQVELRSQEILASRGVINN